MQHMGVNNLPKDVAAGNVNEIQRPSTGLPSYCILIIVNSINVWTLLAEKCIRE